MKKVLLLSLSLVLGFSAFAQQRVAKNDLVSFKASATKTIVGNDVATSAASTYEPQAAKSIVVNRYDDMEEAGTMETTYDLQSNSWCSNRMYQLPSGAVGVVGTMSKLPNQTATDRGTGYNFYNGSEWDDMPETRVEPFKTGWPTICQYGENGEIMISHAPVHCWLRETAGEGDWVDQGVLPASPEGYPFTDDLAWPRVATSGENHDIIHVIADIQHSFTTGSTTDSVWHHQVYYRSLDAGLTWETQYSPLAQDGEEANHYSADAYNIAANGHNVAIIYSDDLQSHVVMYKSTDDGATWTRTVIWENPYYGCDWSKDSCSLYTDTMFGPTNVALAIDNNGVCHVAMSVYEYIHDEMGDTYTTWSGRAVDGIYYWNDTREAPITDTYHEEYVGTPYEEHFANPNPHHALRLWWPDPENAGYVHMNADTTKWIGYLPMFYDANGTPISYENDYFYREKDYFYKIRSGQSAMPALSIDPLGNIACAYSAPCTMRQYDGGGTAYYLRSIYVSYYNVDEGYWHQVEDILTDPDVNFEHNISENIYTISANNTYHPGEFWFGYQSDEQMGLYWGSNATQAQATTNTIYANKVIAPAEFVSVPENNDAQDVIYSIYPNPATNYMVVSSAMDTDATITIFNIVGQTVSQFNKRLGTGENTINIDLKSGVYFCTISANGFDKTVKVVVK